MTVKRVTLLAAGVAVAVAAATPAARPAAQDRRWRVDEPLVVTGVELAPLFGAAREQLTLWTWRGGHWQRAPLQLDERNEKRNYVREDGLLDEDDELILLAADLGAEAPPGAWPPEVGRQHPGLEVRASDPLTTTAVTYGYLFRDNQGPPDAELFPPKVTYDEDSAEIHAPNYVLGLARQRDDRFVGIKRLSLFGDETNLVDRSKLRTKLRVSDATVSITEDNVAWAGLWISPLLRASGPLRVVITARGVQGWAYASRIVAALPTEKQHMPKNVELRASVRVSLDFSPEAAPATYRDANMPTGVTVDGRPDREIPAAPIPAWREVVFAPGRLVLLWRGPDGMSLYYKDNKTRDLLDTGDKRSYADNGVQLNDIDQLGEEELKWSMIVLPHDSPVTAEQLAQEAANTLQVSIARWSPPAPTLAATPSLTATGPAPAATHTGTPDWAVDWWLFMPRAER